MRTIYHCSSFIVIIIILYVSYHDVRTISHEILTEQCAWTEKALTRDVQVGLRQYWGTIVNRFTRTIKNTSKHIKRDGSFQNLSEKQHAEVSNKKYQLVIFIYTQEGSESFKWAFPLYSVPVLCNCDTLISNNHGLTMSKISMLSLSLVHHANSGQLKVFSISPIREHLNSMLSGNKTTRRDSWIMGKYLACELNSSVFVVYSWCAFKDLYNIIITQFR
jgi:hypothetical protein